jgi:hypothetical protein
MYQFHSIAELNIGIMCACMPTVARFLRPHLARLAARVSPTASSAPSASAPTDNSASTGAGAPKSAASWWKRRLLLRSAASAQAAPPPLPLSLGEKTIMLEAALEQDEKKRPPSPVVTGAPDYVSAPPSPAASA